MVLTVFTGQNTSLPIHTTVVAGSAGSYLQYSLHVHSEGYGRGWVGGILSIDRDTGQIWLRDRWEERVWKKKKKLQKKGKHKEIDLCNVD